MVFKTWNNVILVKKNNLVQNKTQSRLGSGLVSHQVDLFSQTEFYIYIKKKNNLKSITLS